MTIHNGAFPGLRMGFCFMACFCLACFVSAGAARYSCAAQAKDNPELQQALNKMEEVAKSFRGFSADFSQKKYTAILKEFDSPDSGKFYYAHAADDSVLMRHEVTNPGKRILTIRGDTAKIYQPVIKQAQIYSLGKYRDLAEYLALGIGQHPAKLREKFNISYQGSESLNDSSCYVLVFNPKDPKAAAQVSSITIWLKKSSGLPIQYKFQEPGGDYLLVSFSEEKLNPKIPASKFEQNFGRDVEIQRF